MALPVLVDPARRAALHKTYGSHYLENLAKEPVTEQKSIEADIASLKSDAENFQQRLQTKIQPPDAKAPNAQGLHRTPAVLVKKLEAQEDLLRDLGPLQSRSRALWARLNEFDLNYTVKEHPGLAATRPAMREAHAQAGRLLNMSKWHAAARKPFGDKKPEGIYLDDVDTKDRPQSVEPGAAEGRRVGSAFVEAFHGHSGHAG